MSGIIGHAMYATLAAKAAEARGLPVAPIIQRHYSSYLSGAYLGCDVQTVPAAICVDSGKPVGYGSGVPERSPLTGGEVKPWSLPFRDTLLSPREIHETFYGRAHLILGWTGNKQKLTLGWSAYLDFAADVAGDAIELFGPGQRPLAWVLGWISHVAGDGLIKAVLNGLNLHLIDGKYTPTNRPVQDLVTFHEVGRKELGLNWAALLDDLARAPVEPIQIHYMRCGTRQGRLGAHVEDGWAPELAPLLRKVLAENHRYQRVRNPRIIEQLALSREKNGELACDPELSRRAGGLRYREMCEAAEKARFRHALWQLGELIADVYERIIDRQELLQELPVRTSPGWSELTERWTR